MLSVYDKIQNACFQLNHDAYILQSSQKKHMRQFSPCEKSLVLLACLREETHFGMAMAVASRTQCNCHNNLSEDGLWARCFDDTARQNHYAGAARHLTKRATDDRYWRFIMNICCSSCGKGVLLPIIRSKPYLIIKEVVTENEIQSGQVFTQSGKNKYQHEENTASYYLAKEMGKVGLQFSTFSFTNFYMHVPPKPGRTKESKAISQGCTQFSIDEMVKVAKDMKIIFMMGAEVVKTFTGYNTSDVYGLVCKSELLPNVPIIIPAPNSDKLMSQPIGELRNALKVLADEIKAYEQYSNI